MTTRLIIAYLLIALMVLAAIVAFVLHARKRREDHRIRRGGRPR